MEDRSDRREALIDALRQMDALIDTFESSLKKDCVKKSEKRDFSQLANNIYPDIPDIEKPEDERSNMSFDELRTDSLNCQRCGLCKTRHNVVFGEGISDRPQVMVIGEGPGEKEDLSGRPFVGDSGRYLDKWLASISLSRTENCYIANVVKCRPPMNRDPLDTEKEACMPYLAQQIEIINPRAILCLGKPASSMITGLKDSTMGQMRGRLFFYGTTPVFCTYHPAAVLRDMSLKQSVWEDLKKLASFLNLEINGVKR